MNQQAKIVLKSKSHDGEVVTIMVQYYGTIHSKLVQYKQNSFSTIENPRARLCVPPAIPKDSETFEKIQEATNLIYHYKKDHPQLVRAYLRPFSMMRAIITTTSLETYIKRLRAVNNPYVTDIADKIMASYSSSPVKLIGHGEWHLPFIKSDEMEQPIDTLVNRSAIRVLNGDMKSHTNENELAKQLIEKHTLHVFEHQAMAINTNSVIVEFELDQQTTKGLEMRQRGGRKEIWSRNFRNFLQARSSL